ncbi:MAG: sce7726 family protein [Mesorhizobium sp.]|nr:sce7726 family protein [Mesorhizobium sp.]TIO75957.1 MAG: sce7726 family protein [Mesorhizobium sp.]
MRDKDVRLAVRNRLEALHKDDEDTRIVEEMGVWSGSVRVDLAVINGELSGFELKSDSDTLQRLPIQADIYSRVFDQVTLVVGRRHADKASDIIPSWWGVMVAEQTNAGVVLECHKYGSRNPSPDPKLVAGLLWKEEALEVLEVHGLAEGWRSKPAKAIHQRLAEELSLSDLGDKVREALKSRVAWLRQPVSNMRNVPVQQQGRPLAPAPCAAGGDSVMLNAPITPTRYA